MPIMWLYAARAAQTTVNPETGRLKFSHSVYVEFFLVESWVEHLRQHHRITQPDQALQARVRGFHTGSEPPRVSHLIAEIF